MHETSKAVLRRLHDSRFATRYFSGDGLDIGAGGDPLGQYREQFPAMRSCREWDLPQGDAQLLATVPDASVDFVHSSHCLEHMRDPYEALHHWLRVLKPGGHMVVLVPDEDLYEQGVFPSTFNSDHKWTFTICKPASWSPRSVNLTKLLAHFAAQAQVVKMETLDAGFRYQLNKRFDQTLTPVGECAIEFVLRRLPQPMPAAPAAAASPPTAEAAASPASASARPPRIDVAKLHYSQVQPIASYSPWLADAQFLAAAQAVQGSTLVDHLRLWELWTLAEATRGLAGGILEVGVWRGGSGALLARRLALLGDTAPLVLCDTFAGVVKAGGADLHYDGGEHADTSIEHVEALLARVAPRPQTRILTGIFPDDTGEQVRAMPFRLVHIDVDVYASARDILDFVWPHMPAGGVVVYDDYGFHTCTGITQHVEEQRDLPDRLVVHNLNGHALVIKR
jgi:SAM-dependent methyltransferase